MIEIKKYIVCLAISAIFINSCVSFLKHDQKKAGDTTMETKVIFKNRNKLQQAIHKLKEKISNKPQEDNFRARLSSLLYSAGEFEEALSEARKALKINKSQEEAILNLGKIVFLKGKYQKAIQYFEKVVSIGIPANKKDAYSRMIQAFLHLNL